MAKKVMLRITTGDPNKPAPDNNMVLTGNDPIRSALDLRDQLTALVGKGNTMSAQDRTALYGSLTAMLGRDKAQKVMNHAYIFNTRPDVQNLPIEDKIRTFYSMGSADPDVHDLIVKTRSLGYGVEPGFRESSSAMNQQLAGRTPTTTKIAVDPEIQKKIMLRVGK
jgi:hypothetical protein